MPWVMPYYHLVPHGLTQFRPSCASVCIAGVLPRSMCKLSSLTCLQLHNNQLQGER